MIENTQHHVIEKPLTPCPSCKRYLSPRKFIYKTRAATNVRQDHKPHYRSSTLCEACRRARILADPTGRRLHNALMRDEVPYVWGMAQKEKLDEARAKHHAEVTAKANASRSEKIRAHHVLVAKLRRKGYTQKEISAQVTKVLAERTLTNASRAAKLRAYHAARKNTPTLDSSPDPTPNPNG